MAYRSFATAIWLCHNSYGYGDCLFYCGASGLGWLEDRPLERDLFHAWGVGLIALGIASLRSVDALKIPQLFWGALGAGLAANLGKLICARTRPHSYDLSASSWDSFQGWFPWWSGAYEHATSASSLQSFPSAHAATAAGLAWGLSRLYPTGRWYFVLLCTLAMAQRLVAQAHYVSDVCWGAALGVIWANIVYSNVKLGQRFAVFEDWLAKRWNIERKNA